MKSVQDVALAIPVLVIVVAAIVGDSVGYEVGRKWFGPLLLTEEILAQPLDYSDFHLTIPTTPGLGIQLDEDRVLHYRRDRPRTTVAAAVSRLA